MAIDKGIDPESHRKMGAMTYDEFADRYLQFIAGQGSFDNKRHTVTRLWERDVVNGQSFRFGALPLRAFSIVLVKLLLSSLKLKGLKEGTKKGLEDNSINSILNVIQSMFTKTDERRLITERMSKEVHEVKIATEIGRLRHLSAQEANELVSECDENLKPIAICALQAGMGKNEILKLTWDRVDMQHGFISLPKTRTDTEKIYLLTRLSAQ